jgi:hypothetical protein
MELSTLLLMRAVFEQPPVRKLDHSSVGEARFNSETTRRNVSSMTLARPRLDCCVYQIGPRC